MNATTFHPEKRIWVAFVISLLVLSLSPFWSQPMMKSYYKMRYAVEYGAKMQTASLKHF